MKKLTSILALTGVVANLGVASLAFAQSSSGSQTIGCNTPPTTPTISVPNNVTFASRTTNFYSETDAPLTTALDVDVTDTRGYDSGANDCAQDPQVADAVWGVQIQSAGLTSGSTTLDLQLGTALVPADLSCTTTCSPATVTTVASASGTTGLISTAQDLLSFSETFSGTIRAAMATTDLEVNAPAGPIPTGTYTGTITFSLV